MQRSAIQVLFLIVSLVSMADAAPTPNLVVIFIDDMGYADVRPFGDMEYPTPNLTRMANDGRCFTDFQVSSAVCSASRAALLTGCYHPRVGIHGALGPTSDIGINANETTLAELCKQEGYATACIGKWHLGHHPRFLPTRHGFDSFYGLPYSNDMWPHRPDVRRLPLEERLKRWPQLPLIENEQVVNAAVTAEDQCQLTVEYTQRAVEFIRRHGDEPFFLYLAHSMVHVPLHVSERFQGKSGAGLFGDVVMEVDWSVGQVLDALEEQGVGNNTLVVLTSDNGPWLSYGAHAGSAGELREGKGTSFEGGTRVPTVMRWPNRIPAGTSCDELAATIDLLPTFAHLIGADLPARRIDGMDIRPLMFGDENAQSPHEYFYSYYDNNQLEAVRDRRWKLQLPHDYRSLNGRIGRDDGLPIGYDRNSIDLELYDLKSDRSESVNVMPEHPEIANRLLQAAQRIRRELGDRLTDRRGDGVRPPGRVEPGEERFRDLPVVPAPLGAR